MVTMIGMNLSKEVAMYKVVIFDVDGTLIDTERSIIMGLHQMLKEETSKEYKEEYLDFVLGIPGQESIKEFNLDDPVLCLQKWKDNMADLRHFNEVYEGIITTLAKLKEKTSKKRASLHHGLCKNV